MKLNNFFKLAIFSFVFTNFGNAPINKSKFVQKPKIIIFDGAQTLITIDSGKALGYVSSASAWGYFIRSTFCGQFNLSDYLTNFYFDTLSKIPSPITLPANNARAYNGKPMPALQTISYLDLMPAEKIIDLATKWSQKNSHQFPEDALSEIFIKSIKLNFDAQTLAKHLKYTKVIKSLEKFYNECDENGKRKNICIIIANQSKKLIPLLRINFAKIFQFSDAQFFSSEEKLLKSDIAMVEKALAICPPNCQNIAYFIDEQKYDAVRKMKVNGIVIENILPEDIKYIKDN